MNQAISEMKETTETNKTPEEMRIVVKETPEVNVTAMMIIDLLTLNVYLMDKNYN
jgi:hypothetical protein